MAGQFSSGAAFRDWESGDVHLYSRITDPSVSRFERSLRIGDEAGTLAFGSGMSAISTLLIFLSRRFSRIAIPTRMYGGSQTLITDLLHPIHYDEVIPIDLDANVPPEDLRDAVSFVETPANPTLETVDLAAWSEFADRQNCELVVDNTVLPHVCQDPIRLGASYAVASCTKAISGGSDVLGGAIWVKSEEALKALVHYRTYLGTILTASVADTLTDRQNDLKARIVCQSENALEVYNALKEWGHFLRCHYPLSTSRGREIAALQSGGLGGGLFTCVPSKSLEQTRRFVDELQLVRIATSFGGKTTTAQIVNDIDYGEGTNTSDFRQDPLVRFSIGIEKPSEVAADIIAAWRKVSE